MTAKTSDDEVARAVRTAIGAVLADTGRQLPPIEAASLLAADVGLDSLDLAQTIVLLERALGVDPFRNASAAGPRAAIRTFSDLVAAYSSILASP